MNTELQIIERLTKQGIINSPEYLLTNIIKESYLTKSIFEMKLQMEDADKKEAQIQRMKSLRTDFNKLKQMSIQMVELSEQSWDEWNEFLVIEQTNPHFKYDNYTLVRAMNLVDYEFIPAIINYIKKHNIDLEYDEDKYEDGYAPETYELGEIISSIHIPISDMNSYEFDGYAGDRKDLQLIIDFFYNFG